jgi:hypothetical protein
MVSLPRKRTTNMNKFNIAAAVWDFITACTAHVVFAEGSVFGIVAVSITVCVLNAVAAISTRDTFKPTGGFVVVVRVLACALACVNAVITGWLYKLVPDPGLGALSLMFAVSAILHGFGLAD